MNLKKSQFEIVGKTTDNKLIINGIYRIHETFGVPLSEIFLFLIKNNSIPNWIELYKDMRKAKIDHSIILLRLQDEIDDSYGKEWSEEIVKTLKKIFEI